jgi:hypothetical protein
MVLSGAGGPRVRSHGRSRCDAQRAVARSPLWRAARCGAQSAVARSPVCAQSGVARGPLSRQPAGHRDSVSESGQLDLIHVLLNPPELLIELVESLSSPLLLTMTIEVGLCVPSEVLLAVEEL